MNTNKNQDASCGVEFNSETIFQRIVTALLIGVLVSVLYIGLSESTIFTVKLVTLSLPIVFFLGLIASVSSCMATSGTVFLSALTKVQGNRWKAALLFNLGRVISYTLIGIIFGYVGKTISINYTTTVMFTMVLSLIMVFVGLDMLRIFSVNRYIPPVIMKRIHTFIDALLFSQSKKTMFILGFLTYLLPCGFTQTVQLYALGTADPLQSGLIMAVFTLGTAPAIMGIGYTASFTKSSWYPWFLRTIAVVILAINITYLVNTSLLYFNFFGLSIGADSYKVEMGKVSVIDGYQIVRMNVLSGGYSPNTFILQKGIPVKWMVNGVNVYGCQGFLNVPKLGIQQTLKQGENAFEFTPEDDGSISFSCSSNSVQGAFKVI